MYYGIPHTAFCGGNARCSTCRNYPPVRLVTQPNGCFPDHIRLACQLRVTGDITVQLLVVDDWDIALQMQGGGIGQEKHLAIMFADIRGFTTRSESMLAYDGIYLLNSYFQCIGRIIHEFGGEINTYIGDGLGRQPKF
ncbi:MAG: hypothetical protein ACK4QL_03750 [Pseudanabaenaceae cyanobacterium]